MKNRFASILVKFLFASGESTTNLHYIDFSIRFGHKRLLIYCSSLVSFLRELLGQNFFVWASLEVALELYSKSDDSVEGFHSQLDNFRCNCINTKSLYEFFSVLITQLAGRTFVKTINYANWTAVLPFSHIKSLSKTTRTKRFLVLIQAQQRGYTPPCSNTDARLKKLFFLGWKTRREEKKLWEVFYPFAVKWLFGGMSCSCRTLLLIPR